MILVALAAMTACSDTSAPAADQRQKGVLQLANYSGPAPEATLTGNREVGWSHSPQTGDVVPPQVIVAPERVKAGEAFEVTTYTVGGGCLVADGQDTSVSDRVVLLTPFDQQLAEFCTLQVVYVPHVSTITLDSPGEWVLRVTGRKVRFGDSTWEQEVSAEVRVLVD